MVSAPFRAKRAITDSAEPSTSLYQVGVAAVVFQVVQLPVLLNTAVCSTVLSIQHDVLGPPLSHSSYQIQATSSEIQDVAAQSLDCD